VRDIANGYRVDSLRVSTPPWNACSQEKPTKKPRAVMIRRMALSTRSPVQSMSANLSSTSISAKEPTDMLKHCTINEDAAFGLPDSGRMRTSCHLLLYRRHQAKHIATLPSSAADMCSTSRSYRSATFGISPTQARTMVPAAKAPANIMRCTVQPRS